MRARHGLTALAAGVALLATVPAVAAQPPEQALLTAPDAATNDIFGHAVAIDGDTAVVGAPHDDDNGADSGTAYIFQRSAGVWTLANKVRANDGAPQDSFGWSVDVSGNTIAIGAPLNSATFFRAGAVYVFTRTIRGWVQTDKLTTDEADVDHRLGYDVSIDAGTIVAGAPYDQGNGTLSGAAAVFARAGGNWTEDAYLRPNDGAQGDRFGWSVSVSGETVVAGAPFDSAAAFLDGSAYVFSHASGTWQQVAKVLAADGASSDLFGTSVAADAGSLVAGSPFDDDLGTDSGSAYVFSGAAWAQEAKLAAPDGAAGDLFGTSVALSGDTAVAGAYADDDAGQGSGSAHAFVRSLVGWSHSAKLVASDASASAFFAWDAAISGETAIAGAHAADGAGPVDSGAASVFIAVGCAEPAASLIEATFLVDPVAADGLRPLC